MIFSICNMHALLGYWQSKNRFVSKHIKCFSFRRCMMYEQESTKIANLIYSVRNIFSGSVEVHLRKLQQGSSTGQYVNSARNCGENLQYTVINGKLSSVQSEARGLCFTKHIKSKHYVMQRFLTSSQISTQLQWIVCGGVNANLQFNRNFGDTNFIQKLMVAPYHFIEKNHTVYFTCQF